MMSDEKSDQAAIDRTGCIAVGFDGSKHSMDAVRWAAHEAVLRSTSLQIMTGPDEPSPLLGYYAVPQIYFEELAEAARETAHEGKVIAQTVAADNGQELHVDAVQMSGSVRPGLIAASRSSQMLVVGSRGHGPVMSELVGSVTSALAAHSSCPVVVIPEGAVIAPSHERAPVIVGIDGSPSSSSAATIAFQEASLRKAGLVAVHGYYSRTPRFESGFVLPWSEVERAERTALSKTLDDYRASYPEVAVTSRVSPAGAVPALQNAAEDAALLVVGSRGRGGFAGMLLGSTSRALMHSVNCPLMIVHGD